MNDIFKINLLFKLVSKVFYKNYFSWCFIFLRENEHDVNVFLYSFLGVTSNGSIWSSKTVYLNVFTEILAKL
jgi:hypothetical protein